MCIIFNSLFFTTIHAAIYYPSGSVANLIADIQSANASRDDDTIDLGSFVYALNGSTTFLDPSPGNNGFGVNGLPPIPANSGKLSIINGTITSTSNGFRFFYVSAGAALTLYQVSLAFGDDAIANGGGAIYNLGNLNLLTCTLLNNRSGSLDFGRGVGGAIYNNGTIGMIEKTVMSGGYSPLGTNGGAIFNDSSGIINIINQTTLSNNNAFAGIGGALANLNIINTISNSTFSQNQATEGGGVFNIGTMGSIYNTTIYGNSVVDQGGGFHNSGIIESITNCTITQNQAGYGGGIWNFTSIGTLFSNIISGNSASVDGGDIINYGTLPTSSNTEGFNLIGLTSGTILPLIANNDIVSSTPLLGTLQDNGGKTFTALPLPGSLAINNGLNPLGLIYDQRGYYYPRVLYGAIDIGAAEF